MSPPPQKKKIKNIINTQLKLKQCYFFFVLLVENKLTENVWLKTVKILQTPSLKWAPPPPPQKKKIKNIINTRLKLKQCYFFFVLLVENKLTENVWLKTVRILQTSSFE